MKVIKSAFILHIWINANSACPIALDKVVSDNIIPRYLKFNFNEQTSVDLGANLVVLTQTW